MPRWIRHLLAFWIALVVAFTTVRSVDAKAPEIGELPANAQGMVGGAPEQAKGPALPLPHAVRVFLPTAQETIPPVPSSYVTKDLGWLELSYPPSASERVASIIREADTVKAEL